MMRRRWHLLAWGILVTVFLGMSIYLLLNPTRTGVVPNYRQAVVHWWAHESIYGTSTHGFLYFPQFILFFTPFESVRPEILGELIWRFFGFSLFSLALWRLAKFVCRDREPAFCLLVLLAVPASLASLNNGQTNLPLSAGLVFLALAVRSGKWIPASAWCLFLIVLKPIALAPCLLALATCPPVRKPLLLGLFALVLAGFLHPDWHYAWDRWQGCLQKIFRSYVPENLRVSDLLGAVKKAGFTVPVLVDSILRTSASFGALGYVWISYQRGGAVKAGWALWVATALVFTILNPRAETSSYVLISPLLAFAAVSYWREVESGRWRAVVLVVACIGLMCDGMGLWIYKATDVWLKPLMVLLVSPLLFRMPKGWEVEGGKGQN